MKLKIDSATEQKLTVEELYEFLESWEDSWGELLFQDQQGDYFVATSTETLPNGYEVSGIVFSKDGTPPFTYSYRTTELSGDTRLTRITRQTTITLTYN